MSGLRDLSPPPFDALSAPDRRRLRDAIDVARFEPGDVVRESEEPGARAGEALVHALQRFMGIRRRRQPEALAGGREAGNVLRPAGLNRREREQLRRALRGVRGFQGRLSRWYLLEI